MADEPRFEQVWPPADALTLVAILVENDTRPGWLRWTWLPNGEQVVLHGSADTMLAGRALPDFSNPHATRAWATVQGWARVSFSGPWSDATD